MYDFLKKLLLLLLFLLFSNNACISSSQPLLPSLHFAGSSLCEGMCETGDVSYAICSNTQDVTEHKLVRGWEQDTRLEGTRMHTHRLLTKARHHMANRYMPESQGLYIHTSAQDVYSHLGKEASALKILRDHSTTCLDSKRTSTTLSKNYRGIWHTYTLVYTPILHGQKSPQAHTEVRENSCKIIGMGYHKAEVNQHIRVVIVL